MLTLDEALARLLEAVRPLAEAEPLATFDALGRVLAADVVSLLDVPPADNTSMDGYALRAADVPVAGTVLPVSQRIAAGVVGEPLQPGTAARIFTGAQVPAGADAVVMQEQCEAVDGGVRVNVVPQPGQWIRRRGEDVQHGSVVLARGTRLTPQALGLAASVGAAALSVRPPAARGAAVHRRRTGDAWRAAAPGRDLQLEPLHAARPAAGLRLRLRRSGHRARFAGRHARRAAQRGGRLRPDRQLGRRLGRRGRPLAPAVQAEGRLDLWQVAIKPGKPLAFGEVRRGDASGAWFIGLPGNPVSSFVTFLLAVRPRAAARCRARRRSRRRRCRCAPISTGPGPTAGASSCACAATPRARWSCSRTRARAC